MKAMPATASNRRLLNQAAPRPDHRVQIIPATMPESTRKRFSIITALGSGMILAVVALVLAAQSSDPWAMPVSFGFAGVAWLFVASGCSWFCKGCGAHVQARAKRCPKCTSFFR